MKSVLYVGATLMIGASIYGFVDYKNSSHKQEFTKMYESKEETLPVITEEKKFSEEITGDIEKKEEVKKQSTKGKFIPIRSKTKDLVNPVEPLEVKTDPTVKTSDFVSPVEPLEVTTDAIVKTDELKENKSVKKIKAAKTKKLNHKLFSRGSMEERYVEKTLKLEKPREKSVTKKSEEKEQ